MRLTAIAAVSLLYFAGCLLAAAVIAQDTPAYVKAAISDTGRPEGDRKRDGDLNPAANLAFSTVKPGDKVLTIIDVQGYYTRMLSSIVGPKGRVYAMYPAGILKDRPRTVDGLKAVASDPAHANVTILEQDMSKPTAPESVDVVWSTLSYHDMHMTGPFQADLASFNKGVMAILKPGGVFYLTDHAAPAGAGFTKAQDLHRAEPEALRKEVMAAGFTFDGESKATRRPNDDYSTHSNDKDDQVIFRFRKPQ
jgi:predicted methyltransferase